MSISDPTDWAPILFESKTFLSFWQALGGIGVTDKYAWFVNEVSSPPAVGEGSKEKATVIRRNISSGSTNVTKQPEPGHAYSTAEFNHMFLRALFRVEKQALPPELQRSEEYLFERTHMPPLALAWMIQRVRQTYVADTTNNVAVKGDVDKYKASTNGHLTSNNKRNSTLIDSEVHRALLFTLIARFFTPDVDEKDAVATFITRNNTKDVTGTNQGKLAGLQLMNDEDVLFYLEQLVENAVIIHKPGSGDDANLMMSVQVATAWYALDVDSVNPKLKRGLKVLSNNLKMFNESVSTLAAVQAAAKRAKDLEKLRYEQASFLQAKHDDEQMPDNLPGNVTDLDSLINAILLVPNWTRAFGIPGIPAWASSFETMKEQAAKLSERLAVWFPGSIAGNTRIYNLVRPSLSPWEEVEAACTLLYWFIVIDQELFLDGDVTLLEEKLGATLESVWTGYHSAHETEDLFSVFTGPGEDIAAQTTRITNDSRLAKWWNLLGVTHLQSQRIAIDEKNKNQIRVGQRVRLMLRQYQLAQTDNDIAMIRDSRIQVALSAMHGRPMGDRGAEALKLMLEGKNQNNILDAWLQDYHEMNLFVREAPIRSVAFIRVDDKEYNKANPSPAALFRLLLLIPVLATPSSPVGVFLGTVTFAYHFTEYDDDMHDGTFRILRDSSQRKGGRYVDLDEVLKAAANFVQSMPGEGQPKRGLNWWSKTNSVDSFNRKNAEYQEQLKQSQSGSGWRSSMFGGGNKGPAPKPPTVNQRDIPMQGETRVMLEYFNVDLETQSHRLQLQRTLFDSRLGFHAVITSRQMAQVKLNEEFVRQVRLDDRIIDTHTTYVLWQDQRLKYTKRDTVFVTFCTSAPHLLKTTPTPTQRAESLAQEVVQVRMQSQGLFSRAWSHVRGQTNLQRAQETSRIESVFDNEDEAVRARESVNSVYHAVDPAVVPVRQEPVTEVVNNYTLQFETFIVSDYLTRFEMFPLDSRAMQKNGDRRTDVDLMSLLNDKYPGCEPIQVLHRILDPVTTGESSLVQKTEQDVEDDDQRFLRTITERELLEVSADAHFRTGVISNTVSLIRAAHYKRMCWLSKVQEKDIVGTLLMFQQQDYRWVLLNSSAPETDPLDLASRVFLYMTVPAEVGMEQRCVVRYTLQPHYNVDTMRGGGAASTAVSLKGVRVNSEIPTQFTLISGSKVILRIASRRVLEERVQEFPNTRTRLLTVFSPSDLWTYTEKACPLRLRSNAMTDDLSIDEHDKARYVPFKNTMRSLPELLFDLYGETCRPLMFNLLSHYFSAYQRFLQSEWLRHLHDDEQLATHSMSSSLSIDIPEQDDINEVRYYYNPSASIENNTASINGVNVM